MGGATARRDEPAVFPPGTGRIRKDAPKKAVNFRCPVDLLDYLDGSQSGTLDRTDVIVHALTTYKDLVQGMGDLWWDVMKVSAIEKVPPGEVLARLALAGLGSHKKK